VEGSGTIPCLETADDRRVSVAPPQNCDRPQGRYCRTEDRYGVGQCPTEKDRPSTGVEWEMGANF
jgi:hypothetical protein